MPIRNTIQLPPKRPDQPAPTPDAAPGITAEMVADLLRYIAHAGAQTAIGPSSTVEQLRWSAVHATGNKLAKHIATFGPHAFGK